MDPFLAEIRIFPYTFAPSAWAFCNGQLLPLSQNTALFALLGTTYGGDGKSTFALPALQGSVAMHPNFPPGNGLSSRFLGEMGGSDTVTLLQSEMPAHTHSIVGDEDDAQFLSPQGNFMAALNQMYIGGSPTVNSTLAFQALAPAGGDLPHNNLQPYVVFNFCIALQGVFPPRP